MRLGDHGAGDEDTENSRRSADEGDVGPLEHADHEEQQIRGCTCASAEEVEGDVAACPEIGLDKGPEEIEAKHVGKEVTEVGV